MAGDWDERTGVDELTDKLTEPSQKRSYYDIWNAAYRGFLPGGLNDGKDSGAPALPEGGDGGPEPFGDTPQDIVEPYEPPSVKATPVVIMDDMSRVAGSVERYFNAYQVNVGSVGATPVLNRDPRRTRVRLFIDGNSDNCYIGETESVGTTGFVMTPSGATADAKQFGTNVLELSTTRQLYAQCDTGNTALLYVLVEYEKEI